MYDIGQAFGLLSTACCLLMPMLKRKQQMLWANAANNALVIVNILLISGFGSAIMVCAVAVAQSLVAIWHINRGTPVSKRENIIFLVLYIGCGVLGFRTAVDALPIIGAVFNMLATFQRDEQRTRWLLLINAAIFAAYYCLIGSAALLSVLCTIGSTLLGLWRYRKRSAE